MKIGDLVYPSNNNPFKFRKSIKLPFKIVKIDEHAGSLILEREAKSGKKRREGWWIGFWQTWKPTEKEAIKVE